MPEKEKPTDFITELQSLVNRSGVKRPAASIVQNIDVAAMVSKFVKPREENINRISNAEAGASLMNTGVEQISKSIMQRVDDNENIFKLFPDIELAAQIIISSILSPKDMVKSELIYRSKDSQLPAQMVAKMVRLIQEEVELHYKPQAEAATILRDSLFRTGSHVKAVLPESAVDQIINRKTAVTTESIYSSDIFVSGDKIRHLGILGDPHITPTVGMTKRAVLEAAMHAQSTITYNAGLCTTVPKDAGTITLVSETIDVNKLKSLMAQLIDVSDNYQFLKTPKLVEAVGKANIDRLTGSALKKNATRFATEAMNHVEKTPTKTTAKELSSMLYKGSQADYQPFTKVPGKLNLKRRSVGRPLVLNLPSEATIPVHVPGDYKNHIGYFVLVDVDGNPVTVDSTAYDSGQGMSSMLSSDKSNSSVSSLLTEKARKNLGANSIVPMIDHMTELYADIIENDLLERLLRGSYGRKLEVGRNNEIYRIMLARSLQSQFTRLIYIPNDYVTYFAFNFHRNGVGKSYLDDLSNITSLRAMVLFSKVMAKVKSSIATTHVNVTLDQRDHDPVKTIEMAKHLVAKARQQYFPHGLNRVVDLTDWIQRAGIEITFEGHPRLPNTKFDFESKNLPHVMPDDDLEEIFRHQTYMHFGLSPETVDSAAKADFATTIEQNSILFARRIMMLSDTFSACMTDYVQKLVSNDETILEQLSTILSEHKAELEETMTDDEKEIFTNDPSGFTQYVLQSFIELLQVDLPKPEATRSANQKTAIEAYEEMVDKGLSYIFSADVLPEEFGGKTNEYVEAVKTAWKAALMRRWMADNNYAPEIFDITNRSEDGQPMANLLESTKSYTEDVMLNIVSFLNKMKEAKAAAEKDLSAIDAGDSSGGGEESSSDSSSDGSDEGGDGGSEGTDDFGMGDEGGGNPFDHPDIDPDAATEATPDEETTEAPEKTDAAS